MTLKCVEGIVNLDIACIIMIESKKHRNTIITTKEEYHIYCKLDDLEIMIQQYGFTRVHKSYLVNNRFMKSLCNYKLTLYNGLVLNIPRKRYHYVKEVLCSAQK